MQRHKIGSYAGGAAGMLEICDLLRMRVDPVSTPVAFQEVGVDLNGVPIEAGFGACAWKWDVLPQDDFDRLLELQGDVAGAPLYIHTSNIAGASGIEFSTYSAVAKRPTCERDGLLCNNVVMEFQRLI